MRNDRREGNRQVVRSRIIAIVIAVLVVALAASLIANAVSASTAQSRAQAAETIHDTIMEAAMQCYAIEGQYPPSLEYLEDRYGIDVNQDDYNITYTVYASNIAPTVDVQER